MEPHAIGYLQGKLKIRMLIIMQDPKVYVFSQVTNL